MTVTIGATVTKGESTSTTALTFSYAMDAGANNCLVVATTSYNQYSTGVTFNGVAMTLIVQRQNSGESVEIWRLLGQSGTHDVVVSFAAAEECVAHAITLIGVDQTTPAEDSDGSASASSAATATPALTGSTDGLVLDCLSIYNRVPTLGGSQASVFADNNTTAAESSYGSKLASSASVTMSMTWTTATVYAHAAAAFKAAAVGGTTPKGPLGMPLRGPFGGPI